MGNDVPVATPTPAKRSCAVPPLAVGVNVEWLLTGAGAKRRSKTKEAETPALALDSFARDTDEELLLRQFRRLPVRTRGVFIGLLNELSARR